MKLHCPFFGWLFAREWRRIPSFHPSIYTSRAICSHFNFWTKLSHVNGLQEGEEEASGRRRAVKERVGRTLSHVKKKNKEDGPTSVHFVSRYLRSSVFHLIQFHAFSLSLSFFPCQIHTDTIHRLAKSHYYYCYHLHTYAAVTVKRDWKKTRDEKKILMPCYISNVCVCVCVCVVGRELESRWRKMIVIPCPVST